MAHQIVSLSQPAIGCLSPLNLGISSVLFTVPRVIMILGNNNLLPSLLQRAYNAGSQFLHTSEKVNFAVTCLRDNLGISFFIFQSLAECNSNTLLTSNVLINHGILGLCGSSIMLHITRTYLSRRAPAIAQYIGPSAY